MLTTRLFPYFLREGRRIMFAAAPAYLWLMRGCVIGGAAAIVLSIIAKSFGFELPPFTEWWAFTGAMVLFAGSLAYFWLPNVTFDVQERVYRRWEGAGSFSRNSRGKFDSLDAIVVTAHRNLGANLIAGGSAVEYRMTLHWKGQMQPPLLLAIDHRSLLGNVPVQSAAGPMINLAQRVSKSLGVRLFDNTHTLV